MSENPRAQLRGRGRSSVGNTGSVIIYGPDPDAERRKGGVATHMSQMIRELPHAGVSVAALYSDWDAIETSLLPAAVERLLGVTRAILKVVFSSWPLGSVVHVNTSLRFAALFRDLPFIMVCSQLGFPTVLQVHGGRLEKVFSRRGGRWLWRLIMRGVDLIAVFPGVQAKEVVEASSERKVYLVVNMVRKTVRGRTSVAPNIVYLGALTRTKGVLDLLEAFGCVINEYRGDISLSLVGAGSVMEEVVVQSRKLREVKRRGKTNVCVHGHVEGDRLAEVLNEGNIFVLPSYGEGLPFAFLECAERGMAPIVTVESAVPSVFVEGEEFIGIRPGNIEELARALSLLSSCDSVRHSLGVRARRAVHERCSVKEVLPRYVFLYEKARREL